MNTNTNTKFINIDTRLNDESFIYSEYFIRLPEKIKNIKSLSISTIELPISFYNVSSYLNNNFFKITNRNREHSNETLIILPDDNYTISSIFSTIKILLESNELTKDLEIKLSPTNTIQFYSRTSEYTIDFLVKKIGTIEEFYLQTKLGWLLGFRFPNYTINSKNNSITAETICDLSYPRYVYLSLEFHDEDNNFIHTSFDSTLFHSCTNKHIIARITLENRGFPYGSILPANIFNGLLISSIHTFHHVISIKKIKVKILDEYGSLINLNGFNISFLISYETEYTREDLHP